jgi:hypothetical protein
MTEAEWRAEGTRRFGPDYFKWRFVCPGCSNVAAVEDFKQYKDKGADPNSATCECIGRYSGNGADWAKGTKPCNYAGYGLLRFSPVLVIREDGHETHCFGFAEAP